MKRLVAIFIFVSSMIPALAQTGPKLDFRKLSTGQIELSWTFKKVYPPAADLLPRFSIEVGTEIGSWQPSGEMVLGESFPDGNAVVAWAGISNQPMAFVRIEKKLIFGGRHFIDRSFTNAVFTGADFSGSDLLRANLTDASLQNAILRGTDLRGATLERVDARGADLILARLAGANCSSSDFRGADLRLSELTDVDLSFATLENADLRGAILEGATNFFTRFHGCVVDALTVMDPETRAVWEIVNGLGVGKNFNGVDLSLSDLSGGNLTNASLQLANLAGTVLADADLSGANLTGATIRFVDLRGTKITAQTTIASKWRTIWDIINNPKSSRSHINADLTLALFVDTVFDRADLRGARFTSGSIFSSDFNSANLQGANFSQCAIFDSDFRSANLTSANLSGALFDGVDLTGATLTGANLSGTTFTDSTMPDGSRSN